MRFPVLAPGDLGTYVTLAQMKGLVNNESTHPLVRGLAAKLARESGSQDSTDHARAIHDWMEERTTFLRDPSGVEALHGPALMVNGILTDGSIAIDCDDVAILAAALGKAIGLHARFVVVGFSPQGPFRHVWAELRARAQGSPWVEFDLTRQDQDLPPRIARREVWPV